MIAEQIMCSDSLKQTHVSKNFDGNERSSFSLKREICIGSFGAFLLLFDQYLSESNASSPSLISPLCFSPVLSCQVLKRLGPVGHCVSWSQELG